MLFALAEFLSGTFIATASGMSGVDINPAIQSTAESQENTRKKEALTAQQGISGTCLLVSNGAEMPCPTLTLSFKHLASGDTFLVKTTLEGTFDAILPTPGRYALSAQSNHYKIFPSPSYVVAGQKHLIVKVSAH